MTLREALVQFVAIRRALGTKLAEPASTRVFGQLQLSWLSDGAK